MQERTSRETRRRSRVVQVFPSVASPARLVGAVMCERDEEWSESRYFSERRMAELCEDGPKPEPPSEERREELRLVAEQAIKASLELADRMEAAWDADEASDPSDDPLARPGQAWHPPSGLHQHTDNDSKVDLAAAMADDSRGA